MSHLETDHLRVLIANERKDRLALVAPIVVALGHEVIAREIDVEDVGAVTARERPDVALVGLGESSQHALELIDRIVREAACPVIVLLHSRDPEFVKEASKRGVFAHINDTDVDDWQSAIDIVLRRFAEYHDLAGRVRTPRHDRTSQGHPDGTPRHRRTSRLRNAPRALPHPQPQTHRPRNRGGRRPPTPPRGRHRQPWPDTHFGFRTRIGASGWQRAPRARHSRSHRALQRRPSRTTSAQSAGARMITANDPAPRSDAAGSSRSASTTVSRVPVAGSKTTSLTVPEVVAHVAQRALADQVELAVGGGAFVIVAWLVEGALVGEHHGVGPEPADVLPGDQKRLAPLAHDERRHVPLAGRRPRRGRACRAPRRSSG